MRLVLAPMEALPKHAPGHIRQWPNLLRRNHPRAGGLFEEIRSMRHPAEIDPVLMRCGIVGPLLAAGVPSR
ncbi:Uncharacterized protein pbN1_04570 [Aromatoleum bremense]|nr:Uncharacterized protein pbN1_04570 [Aromatoleum bremense]